MQWFPVAGERKGKNGSSFFYSGSGVLTFGKGMKLVGATGEIGFQATVEVGGMGQGGGGSDRNNWEELEPMTVWIKYINMAISTT